MPEGTTVLPPPTDADAHRAHAGELGDFQHAGFARRLAAFVIDFVAFTLLQIAAGIPLLLLVEPFIDGSEAAVDQILIVISIVVGWLYYAFFESSAFQATPGKKLLGIQAVDLCGNRIGFWRATIRHFAKFISSLFFFLGFVIIDFTKRKQGMHDMIARTLVIVKPKVLVASNE